MRYLQNTQILTLPRLRIHPKDWKFIKSRRYKIEQQNGGVLNVKFLPEISLFSQSLPRNG